jgi:hypothetical protein
LQAAQQNEENPGGKDNYGLPVQKKLVQLARSDPTFKFLIVALEGGQIQINNLFTGSLIYNNYNVEAVDIGYEIAQAKFFFS